MKCCIQNVGRKNQGGIKSEWVLQKAEALNVQKGKATSSLQILHCVRTPPLNKGIQIPGKAPWVTFPRSPQSLGFAPQDLLMRVPAVGGWCLDLKEGSSVYAALTLTAIATRYVVQNVHYSTHR